MTDVNAAGTASRTGLPGADAPELLFLQRAARLLLTYNMRTSLLRERIDEIARALNLSLQVSLAYRTATIYAPGGVTIHAQTPELRINVAVSARVNRIIDAVCVGKLPVSDAIGQLDDAERSAERHDRWVLALIFGLGAGALAWLLSADWPAMAVISLSSALGLLLRQELHKHHPVLFALPFVAALTGSLLGGMVIRMGWTQTPGICLIVPALMLVPGPHLINGLYDMLENNMQTGLSRLGLALGILVAAAAGVFAGGYLTLGMTTAPIYHIELAPISLWLDVILAGVASCAFGAFYNAPWRVLWTSILCGMVGHGVRYVVMEQGHHVEIATLFACFVIGFMAIRWVSSQRLPFAAVAFAGAVPMMPGTLIYRTIAGAMDISFLGAKAPMELVASTMASGFKAGFVVGAMGMGLLAGAWLGGIVLRQFGKLFR
ncbi:threonine/serine exporter ThrE family protein [Uliginosibacterium paludis]|uniref:Threonine/serine exporter family protein n=1 Tax=Uliginosibacterium paludis TaxID=1615952 RepID=A0ABV2CKD1_9RHOO